MRKTKKVKKQSNDLREWFTRMDYIYQGALRIIEKHTPDGEGTSPLDKPKIRIRKLRDNSSGAPTTSGDSGTSTK